MLAKVCSAAVSGIEAYPVEVEVNAGYGDAILVIVGLPDAAVEEARDSGGGRKGFKLRLLTFGNAVALRRLSMGKIIHLSR
jgi:hypothetical protein